MSDEFELHILKSQHTNEAEIKRQLSYFFGNAESLETVLTDYCNVFVSIIGSILADESVKNPDQVIYNFDKTLVAGIKDFYQEIKRCQEK